MAKKTENTAAESKTATTKAAAKPAAEKKTAAAKTEKKTAAKKTTTSAKKTTAATEKAPAKRASKKAVTIESVCTKIEKKISKDNAAAIKEKIAVDIKVWGFEDGSEKKMYIEIKDGTVTVAPYSYDEKDFWASINVANAVAFADGKLTIMELLNSADFYAEGNIVKAVKMSTIF